MALFYLVRHGETDWNRELVFRGRLDVALNEHGRQQAQAAADKLAEVELAALYTSPLARARETADIIAQGCSLQCVIDQAFIDMDFGQWQGLALREVETRFPDAYRIWLQSPEQAHIPAAESLAAVKGRAVAGLTKLAQRHEDAAVGIVSHRVACKLVMAWALGLDESAFWRIRQDTGCVNVLRYDGHTVVQTLNDTCHLRTLTQPEKEPDF
jgi:broad specificity phosphatase PhoE